MPPCQGPGVHTGGGWPHEVKPRGSQPPTGLPWVTEACSPPTPAAQRHFCHQLWAGWHLAADLTQEAGLSAPTRAQGLMGAGLRVGVQTHLGDHRPAWTSAPIVSKHVQDLKKPAGQRQGGEKGGLDLLVWEQGGSSGWGLPQR